MTISSNTARISYTASGLDTFAYTWRILDDDDLLVILTDTDGVETEQVLGTDYEVTDVGDDTGGDVVFTTAPTATDTVTIILDPARTQTYDLTSGVLSPASLEGALDKLTNIVKRCYDFASRALTRADGSDVFDAENATISNVLDPEDDQDAATKAYVDAAVASLEAGNTTVSAFGSTLIDDANASVARTTLGATSIGDSLFTAASANAALQSLGITNLLALALDAATSIAEFRSLLFIPDLIPYSNFVDNGDFQVWQLGSSITNATTFTNNDDSYFADRWILLSDGNSTVNISNNATTFGYPAGCRGMAEFTTVTTAKWGILHALENANSVPLRSKSVTVSLWGASNSDLTGFRVHLVSWNSTAAPSTDSLTSDIISAWNGVTTKPTAISGVTLVEPTSSDSGDATLTLTGSTYIQRYFTFTVPADAENIGIFICTNDASHSAGVKVAFSGVQLSHAELSTPFQSRPFAVELAAAQRHYMKTFPYATAPATNVGSNTGSLYGVLNAQGSGSPIASVYWSFPQTMLKTPTVVVYNPNAAATTWDVIGNATTVSASVTGESVNGALIYSGTAAGTGILSIHATADARL